jgi:hypothetical protein
MAGGRTGAATVQLRLGPVRGRSAPRYRPRSSRWRAGGSTHRGHRQLHGLGPWRRRHGDDPDRRRLLRDAAPTRVDLRVARNRDRGGRPGRNGGRQRRRRHACAARAPRRSLHDERERLRRSAVAAAAARRRRSRRRGGTRCARACRRGAAAGDASRRGGDGPSHRAFAGRRGSGRASAGTVAVGRRTRGRGRCAARGGADTGSGRGERAGDEPRRNSCRRADGRRAGGSGRRRSSSCGVVAGSCAGRVDRRRRSRRSSGHEPGAPTIAGRRNPGAVAGCGGRRLAVGLDDRVARPAAAAGSCRAGSVATASALGLAGESANACGYTPVSSTYRFGIASRLRDPSGRRSAIRVGSRSVRPRGRARIGSIAPAAPHGHSRSPDARACCAARRRRARGLCARVP